MNSLPYRRIIDSWLLSDTFYLVVSLAIVIVSLYRINIDGNQPIRQRKTSPRAPSECPPPPVCEPQGTQGEPIVYCVAPRVVTRRGDSSLSLTGHFLGDAGPATRVELGGLPLRTEVISPCELRVVLDAKSSERLRRRGVTPRLVIFGKRPSSGANLPFK